MCASWSHGSCTLSKKQRWYVCALRVAKLLSPLFAASQNRATMKLQIALFLMFAAVTVASVSCKVEDLHDAYSPLTVSNDDKPSFACGCTKKARAARAPSPASRRRARAGSSKFEGQRQGLQSVVEGQKARAPVPRRRAKARAVVPVARARAPRRMINGSHHLHASSMSLH